MTKLTNEQYDNLHEINCDKFNNAVPDAELDPFIAETKRRNNNYKYCAAKFSEQIEFIEEQFYKTTGGRGYIKMKRMRVSAQVDVQTNDAEIHNAIRRRFGLELDKIIDNKCVYLVPVVTGQKYLPYTDELIVTEDWVNFTNTYIPPLIKPTAKLRKRPAMWQKYLDRFLPRDKVCWFADNKKLTQQYYLDLWIAQLVQNPVDPPSVALLLRGVEGTGKSFWSDNVLPPILGKTNVKNTSLKTMKGEFISAFYETRLLVIEEVEDNRPKALEALKPLVTQESRQTRDLHQPFKTSQKYFGLAMSSNFRHPIQITENDRRFFVPHMQEPPEDLAEKDKFFSDLTKWLEEEGGFQEMCNWFNSLTPSIITFRQPPMTAEKAEIADDISSRDSKVEAASLELERYYSSFHFSTNNVSSAFKLNTPDARRALKGAGFVSDKRRWISSQNPTHRWIHKDNTDKNPSIYTQVARNI